MNKNILWAAAIAGMALAGCSETETVDMPSSSAIKFGNAFVGKPVRGTIESTQALADEGGFRVYGGPTGKLTQEFNGVDVASGDNGSSWSYTGGDRYWTANTAYVFSAYAPTAATGTFTPTADGLDITGFTADGTTDLITATQSVTAQTDVASYGTVELSFSHLLSMIKFTFTNEVGNHVKLEISDLKVNNVPNKGNYTASTSIWNKEYGTTTNYTLNDVEITEYQGEGTGSGELIVLPQDGATPTLSMSVRPVYTSTNEAMFADNGGKRTVTVTLPATSWVIGNRYNYTANIKMENLDENAKPIVFTVKEVPGWGSYTDANSGEDVMVTE